MCAIFMGTPKKKKRFPWTPERHRMYEQAISKLRLRISEGQTYFQAVDTLADLDLEVRTFIEEDFLKILIAEEHFGADVPIEDMALFLGLPLKRIETCRDSLIQEMNVHDASHFEIDNDIPH
jgi:hypothetical protein